MKLKFNNLTLTTIGIALSLGVMEVKPAQAAGFSTVFFEDFESGLSAWTGKAQGAYNGVIVNDPLQGDQALTFTRLNAAGDIFSRASFTSPSGIFRLSFDYLGIAKPASRSGDLGGFAGYSLDFPGSHYWVAGTQNSYGTPINLIDDGKWYTYSYQFNSSQPIHAMLEDFNGSGGIPGDAYFDNIRIEVYDPNKPVTTVIEPSTILALSMVGMLALLPQKQKKLKSQE